jgi:cell division septation protein DedD
MHSSNNRADMTTPDPLKIRMIGAIFWAGLLVYFVPVWFMHPVDFSPNTVKERSVALPIETITTTTALADAVIESTIQEQETPSRLFIDKPLTVTPPPADPARVQALHQSLSAREAQMDVQSRLKLANHGAKLLGSPPEVSAGGRFHLQVATYKQESAARDGEERLKAAGFPCRLIVTTNKKGAKIYSLRAGPYQSSMDAQKAKSIVDARFNTKSVVLGK